MKILYLGLNINNTDTHLQLLCPNQSKPKLDWPPKTLMKQFWKVENATFTQIYVAVIVQFLQPFFFENQIIIN